MHAGKCNVCSKEVGTQRGRKKNNELTHVVKPHLLSGVNVAILPPRNRDFQNP